MPIPISIYRHLFIIQYELANIGMMIINRSTHTILPICLRVISAICITISLLWLYRLSVVYSQLAHPQLSSAHAQEYVVRLGRYPGILIISNNPSSILKQTLAPTLHTLEHNKQSAHIHIYLPTIQQVQQTKQQCVSALSNFHILSSQVVFVQAHNMGNIPFANIQCICISEDMPAPIQDYFYALVEQTWEYTKEQVGSTVIIRRQTEAGPSIHRSEGCKEHFNSLLNNWNIKQNISSNLNSDIWNKQLLLSQYPKSISEMPNSKHIIHTSAMLMNWLYGQHISILYIAYTHNTDAYVKYDIMHYIMALAYLQDTRSVVQLEVLLDQRDTEFSRTINRNLVVNDITYRLGTYAYADGLVLMGVGQLVKDIQKLRMSIIKQKHIVLIQVGKQDVQHVYEIDREFIITPVLQTTKGQDYGTNEYVPGLYIVSSTQLNKNVSNNVNINKNQIMSQTKNGGQHLQVRENNSRSYGYIFNNNVQPVRTGWIRETYSLYQPENQCPSILKNSQISKYYSISNTHAYTQLAQYMDSHVHAYTNSGRVLWCAGDSHFQLFRLLGTSPHVNHLLICPDLIDESQWRQLTKMAVLHDYIGKLGRQSSSRSIIAEMLEQDWKSTQEIGYGYVIVQQHLANKLDMHRQTDADKQKTDQNTNTQARRWNYVILLDNNSTEAQQQQITSQLIDASCLLYVHGQFCIL